MIPACIFPSPTSVILVLLCCGYYSIQIFYQLEISKDTNIRNFLPCKLSTSGFLALIWFRLWCWTYTEMSFFKITNNRISCRCSNSSAIIQDFWLCSGVDFGGGLWRTRLTRIEVSPMLNLNTSRWVILCFITCKIILRNKCLSTSTNYELLPNIT